MTGDDVRLKQVTTVTYGLGQPPSLADDGVPIIRATNIHRGTIVGEGLIFAKLDDLPLDRAPLLKRGEVLVVRSGAYTGDSALVTPEWAGAAPGYDLRITPGRALDPRFLAYSLLGRRALDQIALASSRAAQPHLNAEELGELTIWCPPRPAQRAVADFLDGEIARIDQLVDKKRRMLKLVTQRFLVWLNVQVWESGTAPHAPLMALTDQRRPIMYGIVLPGPDVEEGVPIVKGGDVARGALSLGSLCRTTFDIESRYARSRLQGGDLVFAIRGGIGDVDEVPIEIAGANITQDVARISPAPEVDGRWLLFALRTPYFQFLAAKQITGATIHGLNIRDLKRLPLPVPPHGRQKTLALLFDREWSRIEAVRQALTRQIALLREHRQALITAAVSGYLEIPGVAA